MKSVTFWLIAPFAGVALVVASCSSNGGGGDGGGGGGGGSVSCSGTDCSALCSYKASTTTQLTLTNDILPILQDQAGCSTATICHGTPPVLIDSKMSRSMTFAGNAATVLATLTGTTSVNAPSMKIVVPGNVEESFISYKISGANALACANSVCQSGASVGASKPCGDPMPVAGIVAPLTDANKTKILDWIAQGAAK